MKRVYSESIKKWAIRLGIPSGAIGTFAGLFFLFLSLSGAITITGFSGDQVCAGTPDDPCYAYINFTAEEDIFMYPLGYDPWGRETPFEFSPAVESWKLQRSWGNGWRDIPLDTTCTGTWCGAPNNKGVSYSYVFRENKDYQFRIVAMKKNPSDVVKWAVNYEDREYLDPTWLAKEKKDPNSETKGKNFEEKCVNGKCNLVIYAGERFVYEEKEKDWKKIEEVKSLKDKYLIDIKSDGVHDVEIVDWNYTSIEFRVSYDKTKIGTSSSKEEEVYAKEVKDGIMKTQFKIFDAKEADEVKKQEKAEISDIEFDDKGKTIIYPGNPFDNEFHFGETSTVVVINSTATFNGFGQLLGETFPPTAWDDWLNRDIETGRTLTTSTAHHFVDTDITINYTAKFPDTAGWEDKVDDYGTDDWISSDGAGQSASFSDAGVQSYSCASTISAAGYIKGIIETAGAADYRFFIILNGGTYFSNTQAARDTWTSYSLTNWDVNPETSNPWTQAEIRNITEFGVQTVSVTGTFNVSSLALGISCSKNEIMYGVTSFNTSTLPDDIEVNNATLNYYVQVERTDSNETINISYGWDQYLTSGDDLKETDLNISLGIMAYSKDYTTDTWFNYFIEDGDVINQGGLTQFKFTSNESGVELGAVNDYSDVHFEGTTVGEIPYLNITYFIKNSPTVTLDSPDADEVIAGLVETDFSCTASDNGGIVNVSFMWDDGGTFEIEETNTSGLNNTIYNFTATPTGFGNYSWGCQACDNEGYCTTTDPRNYSVSGKDIVPIDPTTGSPKAVNSSDNITLIFLVQDDGVNVTSGVTANNITIGGVQAPILRGVDYNGTLVFDATTTACAESTYSSTIEAYSNWTTSGSGTVKVHNFTQYYYDTYTGSTQKVQVYHPNGTAISGAAYSRSTTYLSGPGWITYPFDTSFEIERGNSYIIGQTITTDTVIFRDNSANCAGYQPNQGTWYIAPGDGTLNPSVPFGSQSSYHYGIFGFQYEVQGDSSEFGYITNVGWQANVTVPTFATGLKDLWYNVTYDSTDIFETVTGGINYGVVDTCTYVSGDWEVDCNDNCSITSNVNLGGNNLILDGIGSFFVNANITNIGGIDFGTSAEVCQAVISDGNQLVI